MLLKSLHGGNLSFISTDNQSGKHKDRRKSSLDVKTVASRTNEGRWQRRGEKRAPLSGGHVETWGSLPHLVWVTAPTLKLSRQGAPIEVYVCFSLAPDSFAGRFLWPLWWSQGIKNRCPPLLQGQGAEVVQGSVWVQASAWPWFRSQLHLLSVQPWGWTWVLPFPRHQMGIILRSTGDNIRINWVCVVPGRGHGSFWHHLHHGPPSHGPWAEQRSLGCPIPSSLPHCDSSSSFALLCPFLCFEELNIFILMFLGFNLCSFWLTWNWHIIHIKCWVQ